MVRSRHHVALEAFEHAFRHRDDARAERLGWELLATEPRLRGVRHHMARIFERTQREDEAHAVLADGLQPRLATAIERTITEMYTDLGIDVSGAQPWHLIPRGASAECTFSHANAMVDCTRMLTKVVNRRSPSAARELAFYTRLTTVSPELASLAPKLLDCRRVSNTPYVMLTMEMIDGRRPSFADMSGVKQAWLRLALGSLQLAGAEQTLFRSPYRDGVRRVAARVVRNPVPYAETGAWLHTRWGSSAFLRAVMAHLRQRRAPPCAVQAAHALKEYWLDEHRYRAVEPSRHYSLVHGDFHEANLIVDETTGGCRIIDWESTTWGPGGMDLSKFVAAFRGLTFDDLVRERLVPLRADGPPSFVIDSMTTQLFVVLTIARWLTSRTPEEAEATIDITVEPALAWLRGFASR